MWYQQPLLVVHNWASLILGVVHSSGLCYVEGPDWDKRLNRRSQMTLKFLNHTITLGLSQLPDSSTFQRWKKYLSGMGRSVWDVISGALCNWQGRGVSRTQEHETPHCRPSSHSLWQKSLMVNEDLRFRQPGKMKGTFKFFILSFHCDWSTLLKIRVLYWHLWFREEPSTSMESFHSTKGSL